MRTSEQCETQTTPTLESSPGEGAAAITEPVPSQLPESSKPYGDVGTESLPVMTRQEICAAQKGDPVISPVLHFKSGNQNPRCNERVGGGGRVCLLLKEGVNGKGWSNVPMHSWLRALGIWEDITDDKRKILLAKNVPGNQGMVWAVWEVLSQKDSYCRSQSSFGQHPQQHTHGACLCRLFDAGEIQRWYWKCANCDKPLLPLHTSLLHQWPESPHSCWGAKEKLLQVWFPSKIADQGRSFESAVVRELCKCTGIRKTHTTPYHNQATGPPKGFRTLLNMLGMLEPHLKSRWHEHLGAMTHTYNCTWHDSQLT